MKRGDVLQILGRALLGTTVLIILWKLVNYFLTGEVWDNMIISNSAIEGEYCELNNEKAFFHQSMNTYSNLAYFFFGLIIWQIGIFDKRNSTEDFKNKLKSFPALSRLAGAIFMYLCFGSAFFHASLTKVSQYVDMNGTYGITLILIAIGVYDVFVSKPLASKQQRNWILVLLIVVFAFYKLYFLIPSSKLLPFLMLSSLVLTISSIVKSYPRKRVILMLLSIGLLIWAIQIRINDVQKINCDPLSIWQGHSFWHLLTAMSSFCTYSFYRFQKP